ncbi:MAG: ISKra4 family transposase, partial [Chloroflexia bacterium]
CDCQPHPTKTLRPLAALLPERTSPELCYLESKWASLAAYGVTTELLHEVLPIDEKHSANTVHNHTLRAAQRKEQMLGDEDAIYIKGAPAELSRLPIPDGPLVVGLDGGIVWARRGTNDAQAGNLFEVIAGKSILAFRRDDPVDVAPTSKCFALVRSVDKKPKRRLFELLRGQGMQATKQLTFPSDGGNTVRRLPEYLHPAAEHILDWFHLTMRLTVLQQCARGLPVRASMSVRDAGDEERADEESLARQLESVKHYLWHGNTGKALERLGWLADDLASWDYDADGEYKPQTGSEGAARMLKYVRELETYIGNNAGSIVNYGERYRNGERISTGFVESTINQVISKRMVKKQQMQWTPEGAHLLLQVRTAVLNEDWEDTFRTWYPQFRPVAMSEEEARPAA